MKGMITRAISGIVYMAIIVFSIVVQDLLTFCAIFTIFTAIGVYEMSNMAHPDSPNWLKMLDVVGGVFMFLCVVLAGAYMCPFNGLFIYLLYFIIRMVVQLYRPHENAITALSASLMSQLYVALPLGILAIVYNTFSPWMVLLIFIYLWLNDTGAYCVGCTLGRHKLFERISPKKTWEGFFGGFAFCIIAALLLGMSSPVNGYLASQGLSVSATQLVVVAVLVSVFGTFGDLCESLIKRTAGVKDSGNIIPGHGGILDRIDSLLLATPVIYAVLYIWLLIL